LIRPRRITALRIMAKIKRTPHWPVISEHKLLQQPMFSYLSIVTVRPVATAARFRHALIWKISQAAILNEERIVSSGAAAKGGPGLARGWSRRRSSLQHEARRRRGILCLLDNHPVRSPRDLSASRVVGKCRSN